MESHHPVNLKIPEPPVLRVDQTSTFLTSGCIFSGALKEGVRHGWGQLEFPSGAKLLINFDHGECKETYGACLRAGELYYGSILPLPPLHSIQNGFIVTPHGSGTLHDTQNQYIYQGEFTEGKIGAQGARYLAKQGAFYEGEWKSGLYHGKGKLTYNWGASYDGYFAEGKPHGKGRLIRQKDKYQFEGDWQFGVRSGYGKEDYDGKTRYNGGFINDKYSGKGSLFDSEGNLSYEGRFEAGLYHGEGREILPNGDIFTGVWQHHTKVGTFTHKLSSNGRVMIGVWNDGLIGYTKELKSGSELRGSYKITQLGDILATGVMSLGKSDSAACLKAEFSDGAPKLPSRCHWIRSDTSVYDGEFTFQTDSWEVAMDGKGCLKYKTPANWVYSGEFKQNKRHGYGELSAVEGGRTYYLTGEWNDNQFKIDKGASTFQRIDVENKWPNPSSWEENDKLPPKDITFLVENTKFEGRWRGLTKTYATQTNCRFPIGYGTLETKNHRGESRFITTWWAWDESHPTGIRLKVQPIVDVPNDTPYRLPCPRDKLLDEEGQKYFEGHLQLDPKALLTKGVGILRSLKSSNFEERGKWALNIEICNKSVKIEDLSSY